MSTRCQIGIYEAGEKDLKKSAVLLYRHSDGYPGNLKKGEYGVLTVIMPFLNHFMKVRGWDTEYLGARLIQYLTNESDGLLDLINKKHGFSDDRDESEKRFGGTTGYGICQPGEFHGDIEYFYAIFPNKVVVYSTSGNTPATWAKEQTVKFGEVEF